MTDKCLFINARHFDELKILTMQSDDGSAAAGGPAANNATPSAAKSGWCFKMVVFAFVDLSLVLIPSLSMTPTSLRMKYD